MIDASELRIGNMLLMEGRHYVKVLSIDIDRFLYQDPRTPHYGTYCYYPNNPYSYLTQCSPIPLTLELLIKCGFRNASQKGAYYISNPYSFLIVCFDKNGFIENADAYEGVNFNPFKYLHQLQNLYFALTQKELNIQL